VGFLLRARHDLAQLALIQAPESVRDYIIYHELAHRREMNHSAQFWACVETLFPAWRAAERWLKHEGSLLGL